VFDDLLRQLNKIPKSHLVPISIQLDDEPHRAITPISPRGAAHLTRRSTSARSESIFKLGWGPYAP
jgi:hypothetical protein